MSVGAMSNHDHRPAFHRGDPPGATMADRPRLYACLDPQIVRPLVHQRELAK